MCIYLISNEFEYFLFEGYIFHHELSVHIFCPFSFCFWFFFLSLPILLGLPRWCRSKSTCQYSSRKRCKFSPWVSKIPWSRKCQSIPVVSPGKFHGQRSLADPLLRVTKSWTWLSMHALFLYFSNGLCCGVSMTTGCHIFLEFSSAFFNYSSHVFPGPCPRSSLGYQCPPPHPPTC